MQITIPGKPIAKARPRFARRGKFVKTYNGQQDEEYNTKVIIAVQWDREPLTGPLTVSMIFHMPIPKSTPKKQRALIAEGLMYHVKKPDADNILKFYLDCMNGIVFKDDSQCHRIVGAKRYSENPRTEIFINVN